MKALPFGIVCLLLLAVAGWFFWGGGSVTLVAPPVGTAAESSQQPTVATSPVASTQVLDESTTTADRTAIEADAGRNWVVRGRVLKAPNVPYANAQIEAHCIDGYDAAVEPRESSPLTCDELGRFTWWLPQPDAGVVLRFAGAMPKHGGSGETVRVLRGDQPPQDVEFYAYPFDVVVTGTVRDLAGEAIEGAWVRGPTGLIACEPDGSYQVEIATSFGQGRVTGGAPGHASERRTIQGGAASATADFRLRLAFQIRGRVVDEAGLLVADAEVMTFFGMRESTRSDAAGRFVVDGLDPDRKSHSLVARSPGYVEATEQVAVDEPAVEHELVLRRGARVVGRVFGPDGSPIAGAELYIGFDPSAWNRLDAVSQEDGSFAFAAVGSGAQTLVTQRRGLAPDNRVLQIDGEARTVEVTVQLGAGHFVAGTVVDDAGRAVAGMPISVRAPSSSSPRGDYINVRARSAEDGTFRLEGLPEGRVTLELYGTEWVRTTVEVAAVDCSDLRIVMKRSAFVAGRVVDDETGAPVTSFRIRVVRYGRGIGATWVREGHTFEDAAGRWDSRGSQLEVGAAWGVEVTADGYAAARSSDAIAAMDPDPDACVVRLRRGGTVSGIVVSVGTNEAIADATVTWFVSEDELRRARHEPYGLLRARTDALGHFQLDNVPPGPTQLAIEAAALPRHIEGPFEVLSGQVAQLRIAVHTGARLHGVVVDDEGKVGAGVLHLSPLDVEGVSSQQVALGPDGAFAFQGLPPGEYELFGYLRQDAVTIPVTQIVTLAADQDQAVRIKPVGSTTLTGTINSDTQLPETCSVMLWPTGPDAASRRAFRGLAVGDRFALRGLPAGEFQLLVMADDGGMGSATVSVPASGLVDVTVAFTKRCR